MLTVAFQNVQEKLYGCIDLFIVGVSCVIKTHGSVLCDPKNPGRATDKCVFFRSKENTVFTHL